MGNRVNMQWCYALADALGMPLSTSHTAPVLSGEGEISVDVSGLSVTLKPKVISSYLSPVAQHVLVRIAGNLHLLLSASTHAGHTAVALSVVDAAKIGSAVGWLERVRPRTHQAGVNDMHSAIKASFGLNKEKRWTRST